MYILFLYSLNNTTALWKSDNLLVEANALFVFIGNNFFNIKKKYF